MILVIPRTTNPLVLLTDPRFRRNVSLKPTGNGNVFFRRINLYRKECCMNMNIMAANKKRITKEEAAKMIGLKVYDTALPQQWLDVVVKEHNLNYNLVLSNIVWCYDGSLMGFPCPLTVEGCAVLQKIEPSSQRVYNVLQTR
jgi:hypothetical protein